MFSSINTKTLFRNSGAMTVIYAAALFYCCCPSSFIAGATLNGNNNKEAIDKMALLAIKSGITHDPLGVMSSWSSNDTIHFCNWHGVTCGRSHQRVKLLNLQSSKLKGTLSPYIGNLSFLIGLDLRNNSFLGTIPPEIGKLRHLQVLWLCNNSFGGEIPSNLSSCSRLTDLELHYNKLLGPIPPELGSLSMLEKLSLSVNNLTGTIPSSLGNLSSLVTLSLASNNLIGNIPDRLGSLKTLTFLTLSINRLSGVVPPAIFNLSSLTLLELCFNQLVGTFPSDLGIGLPMLQVFCIEKNGFVGSLNGPLFNSTHIQIIGLSENKFRGPVPSLYRAKDLRGFFISMNFLGDGKSTDLDFVSSLENATMLEELCIDLNNFSGLFPKVLCNFSMLSILTLADNSIGGQIPSCVQNLAYLQDFEAQNNLLYGAIPSSIGKFQNLGRLNLGNNQLSGNIPDTIDNMTLLSILFLSQNNLQGHVPSTLGNCRYLQGLGLSANNLSGKIPSQIFSLSTLSIALDLSNNYFTGSIPIEVGKLENLNQLFLNDNMLSSDLPSSLSTCLLLQTLNLGGNLFQGPIPSAWVAFKNLDELDLSRNNLSGTIPGFLGRLNLKILNISHNNFEGEVPRGNIFRDFPNFSVLGNKMLCGGVPELKLPQCDLSKTSKRRKDYKRKLVIFIICGLCGVTLLVSFVLLYAYYIKTQQVPSASVDLENTLTNLSYQTLLKATNGFSTENLIGSGTFGVVYKGTLNQDQDQTTVVAIKKFNLERTGASKSFMAECRAHQNIRHRNLIKVITACSSIDYQGNDFKALVYEYMENGSLEDWLYPNPSDTSRMLNLFNRFNIAVDVASAIEYLHHRCGTSIVHCDLKPSNVLLDKEMIARVGDFGLSKFLSRPDIVVPHGNGDQFSSIGIRGTVGYTPPEYGCGNEVSIHGDVYSFGILLLELFTGKRPTNDMFKDDLSLRNYVKVMVPEQVTEILDNNLLEDIFDDKGTEMTGHGPSSSTRKNRSMVLEDLISVFEIALACSHDNPQERLNMSHVASKLSSIRNKVLGTCSQPHRRNLFG